MLNPLERAAPPVPAVILGVIYAAVKFAGTIGPRCGRILAAAAVLLLPASMAILGLERNILKAFYPVALARMVHGLGPMYLWCWP